MLLPYPAQFPRKNGKIGSFTRDPYNTQLPSTIQIQSIHTGGFRSTRRLSHGAHGDTAVGMYKNCTKEEALKLAYEHK